MPGESHAAPGYRGAESKEVERKRVVERGLWRLVASAGEGVRLGQDPSPTPPPPRNAGLGGGCCGRVPVGTKGPPCGQSLYQSPALPGPHIYSINPLVVSLGA
jgi:hypothetical protein